MKAVCIGGGNGASQVLAGLKSHQAELTGIIAVTDSGRSTGKIRIAVDIPAPGDIRNILVTLSEADQELKDLFQFRFHSDKLSDLDGMAFGNLFIAALSQMTGSFEQAIAKTSRFLKVKGKVVPVTIYNTHLAAKLTDGRVVVEEVNVRGLNKAPIAKMFLKDGDVKVNPECVTAIREADLITLGPGSLFTTVLACLLVSGLADALRETQGKVVYIANTTTQPGQTDGYNIAMHVDRIVEYLGEGVLNVVLVNTARPPKEVFERLTRDNLKFLSLDDTQESELKSRHLVEVISGDFIEECREKRVLWNKQDSVYHDPVKIADALLKLVPQEKFSTPVVSLPAIEKN